MIKLLIISIIVLLGFNFFACSKKLHVVYKDSVTDSIYANVFEQNADFRNAWMLPYPKKSKIWVEISFYDNHITLAFRNLINPLQNKEMYKLLKKTNRYLSIKEYNIPIIFPFDYEYIKVSTNNSKMIYSGYMIRFDRQGNIVLKGPVF